MNYPTSKEDALKLGISFFEYVRDRICETGTSPPLAAIIREKSSLNSLGWSRQPE